MTDPSLPDASDVGDPKRPGTSPRDSGLSRIRDLAAASGIRRVHVLAWRDLDDVEAGGSEQHAHAVCKEWAAAGLEVTCRTSFAQGHPPEIERDGYRVVRRAGRYMVFPRAVVGELLGHHGPRDALIEIWNGMPFFGPLWARGPRVTFLHHVHAEMWQMVLPGRLGQAGDLLERRLAPPLYRRSRIVTLSESSRTDIIRQLHLRPELVDVVSPGIADQFGPGGDRHPVPTVLAVGRLVPSKHLDELIRAVARTREVVPDARLEVVGDGYERLTLEAVIDEVGGHDWVELAGRVDDDDLVRRYRSAWLLASASSHEGWGMSITEAAACATPAVVTDIAGHRDAVEHDVTGLLVGSLQDLGPAIGDLLADHDRRRRLGAQAEDRARQLTWTATATRLMEILADQAVTSGAAGSDRQHAPS